MKAKWFSLEDFHWHRICDLHCGLWMPAGRCLAVSSYFPGARACCCATTTRKWLLRDDDPQMGISELRQAAIVWGIAHVGRLKRNQANCHCKPAASRRGASTAQRCLIPIDCSTAKRPKAQVEIFFGPDWVCRLSRTRIASA